MGVEIRHRAEFFGKERPAPMMAGDDRSGSRRREAAAPTGGRGRDAARVSWEHQLRSNKIDKQSPDVWRRGMGNGKVVKWF